MFKGCRFRESLSFTCKDAWELFIDAARVISIFTNAHTCTHSSNTDWSETKSAYLKMNKTSINNFRKCWVCRDWYVKMGKHISVRDHFVHPIFNSRQQLNIELEIENYLEGACNFIIQFY